jgi:Cu/Ag efflux protein CusF
MKQKLKLTSFTAAALFGVMVLTNVQAANEKMPEPSKVESVSTSSEVTAKVKAIDYKTRKVTLETAEGENFNIVAGDEVKNFNQMKKGDIVTAKYKEAIVYHINKGVKASPPVTTETAWRARPGSRPEGGVAKEVTVSVVVSAIDPKTPSVTFKGASGEEETFKVKYPEKLNGVNVGDQVDITYSEALALKVEKAPTKQ